jgi:hypothetical protein
MMCARYCSRKISSKFTALETSLGGKPISNRIAHKTEVPFLRASFESKIIH